VGGWVGGWGVRKDNTRRRIVPPRKKPYYPFISIRLHIFLMSLLNREPFDFLTWRTLIYNTVRRGDSSSASPRPRGDYFSIEPRFLDFTLVSLQLRDERSLLISLCVRKWWSSALQNA
jgi:hypothetical protein